MAHIEAAGRLRQETLRLAETQSPVPSLALAALLPPSPAPLSLARPGAGAPALSSPAAPAAGPGTCGPGNRAGGGGGGTGAAVWGTGPVGSTRRSPPSPGAHLARHLLNSPPVQRPRVGLRRWPPREVRPRAPGAATGFLLPLPLFPPVSGRGVARKSLVRASSYRFSSWDWLVCASCTGGHPP